MKKYVVVEGPVDAAIMRTLIEAAKLRDVVVTDGGGKSAAMSFGNSIALSRQLPVAVVVDADTKDERMISEQRQSFDDLKPPALDRSKLRLFLGVPTLEEDLFPKVETFESIFHIPLNEEQRKEFEKDRMNIISHFSDTQGNPYDRRIHLDTPIDEKSAKKGFNHPLLKELFSFLNSSH
jgi:hypothetical protein